MKTCLTDEGKAAMMIEQATDPQAGKAYQATGNQVVVRLCLAQGPSYRGSMKEKDRCYTGGV